VLALACLSEHSEPVQVPATVKKAVLVVALVASSSCGESPDSTLQPAATAAEPTGTTAATDKPPSTVGLEATTGPPNSIADTANMPDSSSPPSTGSDGSGTIEWHAPADAFTIGALPAGFVTRGSPQIVDASFSPTGDSLVSQTFVDVGQHDLLVVSLETGAYAAQQLASGGTMTRTDILTATTVYVSTNPDAQQQAMAWQPTQDSVFWVYGTDMSDDALLRIVRSIQVGAI
jgi:hypothetical protein